MIFYGTQKRFLLLISVFLIKSFLSLVSLSHFSQQMEQSYLWLLFRSSAKFNKTANAVIYPAAILEY